MFLEAWMSRGARSVVRGFEARSCQVEPRGGDTTVVYYYDHKWRLLETRNGSRQTTFQYLWGTRYVDELLWLEANGEPSAGNDTSPDNPAAGESGENPPTTRTTASGRNNCFAAAVQRRRRPPDGFRQESALDSGGTRPAASR